MPLELVGAWRLVSYEDRDSEADEWEQPLGDGAQGMILCAESGAVSFQLYAPNRVSPDFPPYFGYFGTCTIPELAREDERLRGVMTLALSGGHRDTVLEDNPPRPFELSGDTLRVGDGRTWRRTLRRV
jgi:hypothetical protein